MGKSPKRKAAPRTPVAHRTAPQGLGQTMLGLTRANLPREVLAGVTVLAVALPEQLATAQLAAAPAFTALIAYIAATAAYFFLGSNPVLSVGADSTIAPLFAVSLLRQAAPNSAPYLALLAATAVITGLLVTAVGLLRLGWLADFLSLPIVAGFMSGIGVIIVVHQLPRVLGVTAGGSSIGSRLAALSHQLNHVNAWTVALALGTLGVMVLGERVNPRWPTAVAAVAGATALYVGLGLSHHGVAELGAVTAGGPQWRLHWLSVHQWGVVVTTALTLVVVIISQSAATARSSASEIGVADDLDRDFVGVGVANVVAGLCGSMPVDASPARTTITCLAGGRTKMVGLVVVVGALALSPFARYAHVIPLAALAGVLLFIAGRLVKLAQWRAIWRTSHPEFVLALVSLLGVVAFGVEVGLAVAVGLAILDRTWRSSRPRMIELGLRHGTTSWEPLTAEGVARAPHTMVILFDEALYFANAGVFRRELYYLLSTHSSTRHVVIDAVAISDIDYTGLVTLSEVVHDLENDGMSVSVARASDRVRRELADFDHEALGHVVVYASVDAAAHAADHHPKG